MKPKVLKTEAEYQAALEHLETLMDADPGSPQEEELELFSMLVERYEEQHFPIDLPDPVEAILFRMEQQGLTRRDLEAYIGSQSKVSEVLNRKRPLSLAMIRALRTGLDIPAEVLLQEPGKELKPQRFDYRQYPFREMYHAGYFPPSIRSLRDAKGIAEELLEGLFSVIPNYGSQQILCRSSEGQMNLNALQAWQARVLFLAGEQDLPDFDQEKITPEFIREVAKLSYFSQGPLLAKEMLGRRGIPLVILKHLPHTYLDGACFRNPGGRAVIGLTLRHDRLDNFWFTLIHELAHVHLHLRDEGIAFFDDIESQIDNMCKPEEEQANRLTRDLLIPPDIWELTRELLLSTNHETEVIKFAETIQVSPAIVAGRIRWETGDYTRFNRLIGSGEVRKLL